MNEQTIPLSFILYRFLEILHRKFELNHPDTFTYVVIEQLVKVTKHYKKLSLQRLLSSIHHQQMDQIKKLTLQKSLCFDAGAKISEVEK